MDQIEIRMLIQRRMTQTQYKPQNSLWECFYKFASAVEPCPHTQWPHSWSGCPVHNASLLTHIHIQIHPNQWSTESAHNQSNQDTRDACIYFLLKPNPTLSTSALSRLSKWGWRRVCSRVTCSSFAISANSACVWCDVMRKCMHFECV